MFVKRDYQKGERQREMGERGGLKRRMDGLVEMNNMSVGLSYRVVNRV